MEEGGTGRSASLPARRGVGRFTRSGARQAGISTAADAGGAVLSATGAVKQAGSVVTIGKLRLVHHGVYGRNGHVW
jgi:hypothetical protein